MKDFVEKQIEKKIGYLKDFDYLLKEYNEENEIIKGYNGRQLLELLQNCDDEGSTEVLVKLDREAHTITISNNGTPFSEKGYKSLFMPFRSSKTSKKEYIGNKGLGFRSIINWSNQIEIQSNNLSLVYNQESRKTFFYNYFDEQKRKAILKDEGLIETAIPVPFLGIPELKEIETTDYVTSIIITYIEDDLASIVEQVKTITPETLFFLKSLERINFEGFGESVSDIQVHKESINVDSDGFVPNEKITYNDSVWYIFQEEESLGEIIKSDKIEEEFYQIKIAIEENMAKTDAKLYSFFPTNIQLGQPYILHATFDLDSTRNQLVQSDKNKIILNKVVDFTIKVAKYFSQKKVSYKPLQILYHKHEADTLVNLGYYELIEEAFKREEVFPCVNNTYRSLKQVVYFGDSFAKMLQTIKATDILSFHLLPAEGISLASFSFFNEIFDSFDNIEDVVKVLNTISALPLNSDHRALFINEIVKKAYEIQSKYKNKLNLLVDKGSLLIMGDEYVYTPETRDSDLKTPGFTNIKFISRELYTKLSDIFNYHPDKNKVRSRFVSDKLDGLCNIHSYEPANLAQKIIRETKKEIKKDGVNKIDAIKEMNACLFHNFKFINSDSINTPLPNEIPAINMNGDVVFSSDLVLSNDYPKGQLNQIVFEGIYNDENYIGSPSILGITLENEEQIHDVEQFLLWLKVNEFVKYSTKEYNNYGVTNYVNYVNELVKFGSRTGYTVTTTSIDNLDVILEKITLEKFILWIHNDSVLKGQLYNESNTDVFKYFYHRTHVIRNKPSYIKYFIEKMYSVKFHNLLIDEKYNWVNDVEINYRDPLFIKNNLPKSVIQEILVALGAKDNFNDLPIEKVADIINKLPTKYPDGSKSVTFYKKALSHYKENKIVINAPIQLFANDGEEDKIYNQSEVYFSEKIKLPNKLKKDFPIFNFPARSGGVEAIKFFGINDLNDIKIELKSYRILDDLTEQFNEHLTELKPYILSQRIHDFDDLKSQQTQASICSKINLVLCSELEYEVNEKQYSTSNYEYIHFEEQTYYMKVSPIDKLDNLIINSEFTDNIAEILALSFDVKNDKTEFRNMIRSNIEVVKADIIRDFSEDTLKEAKELLGLADYKWAFWQAILGLKGISFDERLDDLALNQLLEHKLNLKFDVAKLDYEKLSGVNQVSKLKNLFDEIGVTLQDFVEAYQYKLDYSERHFKTIRNIILANKPRIKTAIWNKLKNESFDKQKEFLIVIDQFEDYDDFSHELAEKHKYKFQVEDADVLNSFINHVYGELAMGDVIVFEDMLVTNKQKFSSVELDRINHDLSLKSLLHFENALDELKNIVQSQLQLEKEKMEKEVEYLSEPSLSQNELKLISSERLIKKPRGNRKFRKKAPYLPGIQNNKRLKEIGNAAEDVVLRYLRKNNYKNIYKASDDNEGLHYDFRFTNERGDIKFIEAKSFNNGKFHLSKDEFDFGEDNQEDYEIWLVVNDEDIIQIKDFFSNAKYDPIISEYIVYLDLE